MKTKFAIIHYSLIVLIVALCVAGNVVCVQFSGLITQRLCGFGIDFDSEQAVAAKREGQAMAIEVERQGIVMLKNDGALPLSHKKVNVFGWTGCDAGFIYGGGGSSVGSEEDRVSFMSGLRKAGIECNEQLEKAYDDLGYKRESDTWAPNDLYCRLMEPDASFYSDDLISQAKEYSDTALVVIGRRGGEGRDLEKCQYDAYGNRDDSRTYLEISPDEEILLDVVTKNFENVIVVLNAANAMELGFLEDDDIDAALSVGFPGNSGTEAIGEILLGDSTPSGRLVDTYAYDLSTAATYNNASTDGPKMYQGGGSFWYVDYAEDIYVGYKWYETADAEGYWDNVSNEYGNGYDGVVQYPLGYGLSYADFEWTVTEVDIPQGGRITDGSGKITIKVFVENVSETYKGAEVVQLYVTPPYTKGGIEKSSVALCAFAKTAVLECGQGEELELSVDLYDLASYDCYDRNNNGFMGYELECGDYTLSLRTDSHTVADVKTGESEFDFEVADGLRYEIDPETEYPVVNRFTNYTNGASGAVSSVSDNDPVVNKLFSSDGTDTNQGITYLSRSDFAATFPQKRETRAFDRQMYVDVLRVNDPKVNDSDVMPVTGSTETSYTLNDMLGVEYKDPKWDALVSQLPVDGSDGLAALCANGGYHTIRIESIGKPFCTDLDGPSGLTTSNTGADGGKATYYPCESVLAQSWNWKTAYEMGAAIGKEAEALDVDGWYAPGANMHRSPFGGRNFEYYSEDSVLSGVMAAYETRGCIDNGLICYLKHFAVNDSDTGRNGQCRWLTEQSLREIYLKPFEIAVKVGGANAMMSSVDRIGCVRASGNYALLTEVLRNEWGFEGSVVSDYYQDTANIGSTCHDIDEFVRAGNDLALDPSGSIGTFDDSTSATAVIAMQKCAKNILFTYVNTQYIRSTTNGLDLGSAIGNKTEVFPWWIFLLIGIDVIVIGGCAAWGIVVFRKNKKYKTKNPTHDA